MENQNNNLHNINFPIDVTKSTSKKDRIISALFSKPPLQRLRIVAGISTLVLVGGLYVLYNYGPKPPDPSPEPYVVSNYVPPPPATKASPLTGVQVEPALSERAVTGVMIENSIDARPQAGLIDAGVVFEAIAEGGITRFLALFQESQPDYIGPIRSARPYYVRWAAGFDAAYAHSGGSGEALALIRSIGVKDMDHGNNPGYFDRVSTRYAPHNVYTSMARLDSLRQANNFNTSDFTPFSRATEETPSTKGDPATSISFDISSPLYNTSYAYDATTKTYARTMAGQPHLDDKSGAQIRPSVVIALYTNFGYHPDGVHSTYQNVGSGNVLVFQNGVAVNGRWSKPSDTASLKLTTVDGSDLILEPGQTWITAIPEGRVAFSP